MLPRMVEPWALNPRYLKEDPNYDEEAPESLGLSKMICPCCGAHVKQVDGGRVICLNACHLGTLGREGFQRAIDDVLKGPV